MNTGIRDLLSLVPWMMNARVMSYGQLTHTRPSSQADGGGLGKGISGWLQVLSFRLLSPLGRGTESCQYFGGGRDKMVLETRI